MRLAGIAKGGFYPTPQRCVQLLAGLLNAGASDAAAYMSVIRILDPCCGAGDACRELADQMNQRTSVKTLTYGVELEKNRAEQAREQLGFTLSSDIFQTSIANNSFQVLLLNPPYDFDQESKRVEHSFLTHCTKYLEDRGLLVFIVPKHRLGVSARYLASHYTQLECRRFPDPEYDDFDQVMLLGRRRIRPEHIPRMEKTIREWAISDPGDLKTLADPPGILPVQAPTGKVGDILFTIRNVNPTRAAEEARRSGLWTWTSIQESLWPTESHKTQPLMPLRQGHMATLIAAGFLDNLCLETNGKRVLVKGRTTKAMELVECTQYEQTWRDRMHTTIRVLDLDTGEVQDVKTKARARTMPSPRTEEEE